MHPVHGYTGSGLMSVIGCTRRFCEKGSLERAVNQGRFIRRSDKAPEMVRRKGTALHCAVHPNKAMVQHP